MCSSVVSSCIHLLYRFVFVQASTATSQWDPNSEWRNPNTGQPKRSSQGWFNKCIQLAVLVRLQRTSNVESMVSWLERHPTAGSLFRKHLRQMQEHGYDPDFLDL